LYDFEIILDGGIGSRYPRFFINGVESILPTRYRQRARAAWTANNILVPFVALGGNAKNVDILRIEVGQSLFNDSGAVGGVAYAIAEDAPRHAHAPAAVDAAPASTLEAAPPPPSVVAPPASAAVNDDA
jgi:hypothetical protein